jgi:hypothetical protein
MKVILKQLRLFFPHLFPLYIIIPGRPEGLFEKLALREFTNNDERLNLLEARGTT